MTTPFTANALDSEKIGQNLGTKIAQYVGVASPLENRDQNRNDQYRNDRNRDSRPERLRQRQFAVYYRNRGDSLSEMLCLRQATPTPTAMDFRGEPRQSSRCSTFCQPTGAAWLYNLRSSQSRSQSWQSGLVSASEGVG